MTKKVILIFPTREKLQGFRSVLTGRLMQVLFKGNIFMVCECTEQEIELAKKHFEADVLDYNEKFMPRN